MFSFRNHSQSFLELMMELMNAKIRTFDLGKQNEVESYLHDGYRT